MNNVIIKKSNIGQFPNGKGVFANRNFTKGEVVINYNLTPLTEEELENLPESEQLFTHTRQGRTYLYSEPERYVNHSEDPNTYPDFEKNCDIALRDIKKGEEITCDATKEDF